MPLDRKSFFDHSRAEPFGGTMTVDQVQGMTRILDEAERRGVGDPRHLAYRLATVLHETGRAMVPVREQGSESYLRSKPYWPWVGMGLVQVTWEKNGKKFGATKPEDLMSWPVALRALFDGMDKGMFTGLGLPHFFDEHTDDPVGARRIINGLDKAGLVAGYHAKFLAAIKAGMTAGPTLSVAVADKASPVFDSIVHAISAHAAVAGVTPKPAPAVTPPSPVLATYLPPAMTQHGRRPVPLTGWRAVLASVRAHFG